MSELNAGLAASRIRAAVQDAVTIGHPLVDMEKANAFIEAMDQRVESEVKRGMNALIERLLRQELVGQKEEIPEDLRVDFAVPNNELLGYFGKDDVLDMVTMRAALRHLEQDLTNRGGYQASVSVHQQDRWNRAHGPLEVSIEVTIPLGAVAQDLAAQNADQEGAAAPRRAV